MAVLVYAADWLTWRARVARGNGMDTVTVNRMTVAPLKGSKEEYYFDGTDVLPCTRSLLPPMTGDGFGTPCWYLTNHRQVVTRF